MKIPGIIFLLFSLIYLIFLVPGIGADDLLLVLPEENFNINESKLFPYLIGILILVVSLLMVAQGLISKEKPAVKSSFWNTKQIRDLVFLLFVNLVYIILLEPIGFFIVTPGYLVFALLFFGSRKWLTISLTPILMTLFVFLLFEKLMNVQLPKGIMEWMFY